MIFEAGDVVVVPFPFTDRKASKRRPALVLSDTTQFNAGHAVLAMITTRGHAGWPLDVPIQDGSAAGLKAPSVVRMKLFTLDNRLILRKAGVLAAKDAKAVVANLKHLLGKSLDV
ncbi:MAG: type II toxin-antitoxin system PemK/MazF family toxin [Nitrococcus sp.]|nr:type II toxin-antitoxin system PemK/MazF family toxin [Nitrococcus sp.]